MSILQIFKLIRNSGNFKPLLMLIACMCIFISASCIYAADIEDAYGNINHSTTYIDALDDDKSAEQTVTDLDSDADNSANAIDTISNDIAHHKNLKKDVNGQKAKLHHKHNHKNPVNHTTGIKAMPHLKDANITDAHMWHHHRHHHEIPNIDDELVGFNGDTGEKNIDLQKEDIVQNEDLANDIEAKENIPHENSKKAITNNINKILISCNVFDNHLSQNSIKISSPVSVDPKMVKNEFCCCQHCQCNHKLHADIHSNDRIVIGNDNDDLEYSYSCHAQTTNSRAVVINLSVSNEENPYQRSRNLKNVLSIDCSMELGQNGENSIKNHGGNMDANDLSVNCTDCDFNHNALEINLNADELDINDYNLEYYIFTNPYIIIKNANQTTATITPNNSISNIETIFNQYPSIECITDDNYGLSDYTLNITTFFETASPIEVDTLKIISDNVLSLILQSPNNPSAQTIILILGEYKRCLN